MFSIMQLSIVLQTYSINKKNMKIILIVCLLLVICTLFSNAIITIKTKSKFKQWINFCVAIISHMSTSSILNTSRLSSLTFEANAHET